MKKSKRADGIHTKRVARKLNFKSRIQKEVSTELKIKM